MGVGFSGLAEVWTVKKDWSVCGRVCVCVVVFQHAGGTEKGEEIGCPVFLESWHWSANLCLQWIVFKPFFVFVLFVVQCVGICDFFIYFSSSCFCSWCCRCCCCWLAVVVVVVVVGVDDGVAAAVNVVVSVCLFCFQLKCESLSICPFH